MTPHCTRAKMLEFQAQELRTLLTTTEAVAKTCVPGQMKLTEHIRIEEVRLSESLTHLLASINKAH